MVGVTALVVMGCVLLHYEVLDGLDRVLQRLHVHWRRQRLLLLIMSLLLLHIAEIWLFAAGYWWIAGEGSLGAVAAPGSPTTSPGFLDLVYFSAVVYSTLGLGDLVPHGALRFMVGTQAITGFLLVTWSASFTFLEMERWWRRPPR